MINNSGSSIFLNKTSLGEDTEFRINTKVVGSQNVLGSLPLSGGGFMVLGVPSNYEKWDFWGQRYDADGLAVEAKFHWAFPDNVSGGLKVSTQGDDGFVLVWHRDRGDGTYDIFAQKYNAPSPFSINGHSYVALAVSDEFKVSSSDTTASYKYPKVVDFADGSFVVSWVVYNADGSRDIAGQRFNTSGSAEGSIFQVNDDDGLNHSKLIVTGSDSGEFTVVWTVTDGSGAVTGLSGQHFNASGDKSGSVFSVTDTENLGHPDAATLSDGHTVVAWQALAGTENSYDKSFYGRIFDQAGNSVTDAFEIDTNSSFNNHSAYGYQVEALSGGGFAVTWQPKDQDGSHEGVFGRIFASDGSAVTSEIAINSNTSSNQYNKSLVALDDGGFVSVWNSWGQDGSDSGVYGQRFDALGNKVDLVSYAQGTSGDILENSAGAVVGTLQVTDSDVDDSHTLALSGADAASFEVLDGQLKLKDLVSADYETKSSYSVRVTAADSGGWSHSEDFIVNVIDVNDAPTDIALTLADGILGTLGNDSSSDNWRVNVKENILGTVVGTLSTTDPDSDDNHSYSLSGMGSELFEVDSSNRLKLKSGISLDYETQSTYTLTVKSTDSGELSLSEDFIVNVSDVVENIAPTDIALTLANGSLYGTKVSFSSGTYWRGSVDENALGAVVGTLSTTDPDSGDVHSYSLSGVGSELFEVDDNQQLKLKSGVSTDYETQSSYTLTVKSTDSGELSRSEDFIVNVSDVEEVLYGTLGDDVLDGFSGYDVMDGKGGLDTVKYSVGSDAVSFSENDSGQLVIHNTVNSSESDILVSMERIQFSDKNYALDLDGNTGIAAKAIIATFGADTLSTYMTTVVPIVDAGWTLDGLCDLVIQMGLIESQAGSSDMSSFVEYVYGNVVARELNAFENAMIANIASGPYSKSELLKLAVSTAGVESQVTSNAVDLIGVPGSADGELLAYLI